MTLVKKAFVGTKDNLSASELKTLLEHHKGNQNYYYFLRWSNRVSGIVTSLEDFPSPEGQMFNADLEIRWKQKGEKYDVLLLSKEDSDYADFDSFAQTWQSEDRSASFYPKTETRFPKGFIYSEKLNIGQRYFKDKSTGIVHFVALTIDNSIGTKS
jgi:hypothetical protein